MTSTLGDISTPYDGVSENYIDSQLLLQECFTQEGVQLIRVAPNCFERNQHIFTRYGLYTKTIYTIVHQPIRADVIWNRSMHNSSLGYIFGSLPIQPMPQFSSLSDDKFQQYTLLKKQQPYTCLLHNFFTTKKTQDNFGDTVVLKPRFGSGGIDVQLIKKQDLIDQQERFTNLRKRMLVQQYIDNSGGIPGFISGKHDLRVVFFGTQRDHISVRQPTDSKEFRSNVAVGGTETIFTPDVIPPALNTLIDTIQTALHITQEFYSLDFCYHVAEDKRYCFELNASPGIEYTPQQRAFATAYYTRLAKHFKSLGSA